MTFFTYSRREVDSKSCRAASSRRPWPLVTAAQAGPWITAASCAKTTWPWLQTVREPILIHLDQLQIEGFEAKLRLTPPSHLQLMEKDACGKGLAMQSGTVGRSTCSRCTTPMADILSMRPPTPSLSSTRTFMNTWAECRLCSCIKRWKSWY